MPRFIAVHQSLRLLPVDFGKSRSCLRHPDKTATRPVTLFQGKAGPDNDPVELMGRHSAAQRFVLSQEHWQ